MTTITLEFLPIDMEIASERWSTIGSHLFEFADLIEDSVAKFEYLYTSDTHTIHYSYDRTNDMVTLLLDETEYSFKFPKEWYDGCLMPVIPNVQTFIQEFLDFADDYAIIQA
jgi:hypothetical protein